MKTPSTQRRASSPFAIVTLLLLLVHVMAAQDQALKAPATADKSAMRPSWATDVGKDQFGSWADMTVNAAVQRMRWIVPGRFTMGSPTAQIDRDKDEVQQAVTLSHGFWLGDSEVSNPFWQGVMGSHPNGGEGALPVATSWEDGQKFFAKLNEMKPGLNADFPTEAQWEFACRAGTTGPTYAPIDAVAWYLVTSADAYGNNLMHPVKQKQPNAWGLYDMLGNAWESTHDWYGEYPAGAVTDPTGPASGNRHVVRGGSARNAAGCCRAAWRWAEFPGAKGFGLRITAQP